MDKARPLGTCSFSDGILPLTHLTISLNESISHSRETNNICSEAEENNIRMQEGFFKTFLMELKL